MAAELRTSLNTFRFVKDSIDVQLPAILANFDVAGSNYIRKTQTIPITDEQLDLGDVATPGFLFLQNNDPDNFVTVGEDGSSYPVKLRAVGGWAMFEFNGAAVHLIADTAPVKIEALLIER